MDGPPRIGALNSKLNWNSQGGRGGDSTKENEIIGVGGGGGGGRYFW